jgi:quinol monooxygenase YgiN
VDRRDLSGVSSRSARSSPAGTEEGSSMYGTVARTRVRPENRERLRELTQSDEYRNVPGFVTSYTLFENDSDVAWLFAVFSDRATYETNADDPAQHERYVAYRALMEDDPEWHDGEIEQM